MWKTIIVFFFACIFPAPVLQFKLEFGSAEKMDNKIKMVAVDVDGTFVRSDYTYDIPRFRCVLNRMKNAGCRFVVASGNQNYQLRDLFPGHYDELSFVAENGAFVKDRQDFFDLTGIYYHRLQWVDDFREVKDRILKFAPTVPEEKTYAYYHMFRERLKGKVEPTTSGHGSIDLIVPGCHKASGLKRLVNVCPSNEEDGVLATLEKLFP